VGAPGKASSGTTLRNARHTLPVSRLEEGSIKRTSGTHATCSEEMEQSLLETVGLQRVVNASDQCSKAGVIVRGTQQATLSQLNQNPEHSISVEKTNNAKTTQLRAVQMVNKRSGISVRNKPFLRGACNSAFSERCLL